MSYPDEPTIHKSINQFFNFDEEFSQREDFDDAIENWDEAEEGEPHPYLQSLEAFENVQKFIEDSRVKFRTLPPEDIAFPRTASDVVKYKAYSYHFSLIFRPPQVFNLFIELIDSTIIFYNKINIITS